MPLGGLLVLLVGLLAQPAVAQPLTGPFVLEPSSTSFTVVWETSDEGTPTFQWTADAPQMGAVVSEQRGDRWRHRGQVLGVPEGAAVSYRADGPEHTVQLVEPARARIVFISDAQLDTADPFKWQEVADEILDLHREDAVHALVIAGDGVDEPGDVSQFDDFFGMAEDLLAQVPILAVPGNDHGAVDFLDLELPWRVEAGPVTLLGLDSREDERTEEQRLWLDDQLDCTAWNVGVMHHPFGAELFTPDNNGWSESAAATLLRCEDTAVVFGAAHGYWRGESWSARQLLLGAGSAGGPLDYWGTEPQAPSDEAGISRPEYGFLLLDASVEAAVWQRHTLGEGVTDSLTLRRDDAVPDAPPTPRGAGGNFTSEVGEVYAAEWAFRSCGQEEATVDRRRAREEYGGEVVEADLSRFADGSRAGCVQARVRVRSQALVWSEWSEWSAAREIPVEDALDCACSSAGGGWLLMGLVLCRRRR